MIAKETIVNVLDAELSAAISRATSEDAGRRQVALEYFTGAQPAPDDKSKDRAAVSMDVQDAIEAVAAQMLPSFEDVGVIQFEPISEDDEPAAAMESEVIRAMLQEGRASDPSFVAVTEAVKDALLMRSGTLTAWIDRKETRTPETWRNVDPMLLEQIAAPTQPNQIVDLGAVTPEPTKEGEPERVTVKLTRIDREKRLAVAAIAPENIVSSNLDERNPDAARFVADRLVKSRAELVAMGFDPDTVARLPAHMPSTYEQYIRRTRSDPDDKAAQKATDLVEVWRCYAMLADSVDSPRAERYKCFFSRQGKVLLGEPERVGRVCYAQGSVMIFPHRSAGTSLFERIGEIQEQKTRALRAWLTNAFRVNRPRMGVDDAMVNLADANDATQDMIRVKGPNAITPIPTVDAGPSLQLLLGYLDNARSERGGTALEMQSAEMQIASGTTATGFDRVYSTKEATASLFARTFAETALRQLWQICHYLLRTSWSGPLDVKIQGKWQQVDPSKWIARSGVSVRVGMSHTERMRKVAALTQVMQGQSAMMAQGGAGTLVDESKMYNAAADLVIAMQLRNPDRYLINPESQEAQQAAQAKAQQQQQAAAQQAAILRATLLGEKYKVDSQSFVDIIKEVVRLAIEEAKLTQSTIAIDEAQAATAAAAAGAANEAQEAKEQAAPGA